MQIFPKRFTVIIKPNSPKNKILSYDESTHIFKIAVSAAPVNGKANLELLKFLKKQTGKSVKIISGKTSKKKLIGLV
jgi:uncharacterized protein (TIGR00251 family)